MTDRLYFDQFKSQDPFYRADLDESFFFHWYELCKDIWHSRATTCARHLIGHKDCPLSLRDLYIKDPRFEKRKVALLHNAPMHYARSHQELIFNDRSRIVKEEYVYHFLIPWFLGRDVRDEFLFGQLYRVATGNIRKFGEIKEILPLHDIEDVKDRTDEELSYQVTIDTKKLRVLSEREIEIIRTCCTKGTYELLYDLNGFAADPTLGLVAENKNIRRFAENYFRIRNDRKKNNL